MKEVNYTAVSDGTVLLQGKCSDGYIAKKFNSLDDAIAYADSIV